MRLKGRPGSLKCVDLITVLAPGLLGGGPVLLVNGEPLVSGGNRETYVMCVEAKTRSSNPLETLPQTLPAQNLPNLRLWSLVSYQLCIPGTAKIWGIIAHSWEYPACPSEKESR